MRRSPVVSRPLRTRVGLMLTLLMFGSLLSGCFGEEEPPVVSEERIPFEFASAIPANTWYHFPGNLTREPVSALDPDLWHHFNETNWPVLAQGTYFGIGETTFEPTLGVTSAGEIVFTNYRGTGDGTHIIRSRDMGLSWEDVGPFNPVFPSGQVPNSNDPYVYVDPWTDRIVKFDMHALTAMFVEYSDDGGDSWSVPFSAEGYYSPQDHQSIASMPDVGGIGFYETIYVFCINTGLSTAGPQCSRSLNGGQAWDVQRPGYPVGVVQCSGLHAHLVGSPDGAVYRGNPSCDGPAVYRSVDGGFTWTEHTITTEVQSAGHEVATAVDAAGNLYAHWIGAGENQAWFAASQDQGDTWTEPMMVIPPGVDWAGFPTITAGDDGRVAIGYIGIREDTGGWNGYISTMTSVFSERPLITTVAVNVLEDALDDSADCGGRRCGGFGDFIDIELDDSGRPWIALAHNVLGQEGIAGTYIVGPSLYGPIEELPPHVAGGPDTLGL